MSWRGFRLFSIDLAANGERRIDVAGTYVAVLEATGAFQIKADDNPWTDWAAGLQAMAESDADGRAISYKALHLKDKSGAANTVDFAAGYGDFRDGRLVLSGAVSLSKSGNLVTVADVALGAAVATQIVAANAARRSVMITNLTGAAIRVGDNNVAAAQGVQVAANATITLDTTAIVYGFSTPGGNVAVTEVRD